MSGSPPPTPFLSRYWPTLRLLLAAFGIPTTVVAFYLTKYPLLALGIGLLYEVAIFVLSFVGKVWQRLEGPLVEHTADRFVHWIQDIISHYRKQYYGYLYYQHRDFDVKGLTTLGPHALELSQVFVELCIDSITPGKMINNPIQVPQALLEGNHYIWDYLASAPLKNQHLVIIGPPGSGKTTLLKHITLALVARGGYSSFPHQTKIRHKMPILLFLRDHAQAIREQQEISLVNAVHDHLKKWEQPLPSERWLKRHLSKGHCLVMLDGLDEVADPETRQAVVKWVERQMISYRQSRFLVTSRPFGYRNNPLNGVSVLEVRSFTAEQVEQFIHN